MNRSLNVFLSTLVAYAMVVGVATAQGPAGGSQAQAAIDSAAAAKKYTFLVFFKDNSPATQAMAQTVKQGVEARSDRATLAFVNVTNAAEKSVIDRFGVSRAPMPLTVAVAPNGAMTKLTPTSITDQQIEQSFVTPAMAHCMKNMQEGRLVLVCIQTNPQPVIPTGVRDFVSDPEFKNRTAVVPVHALDPAEAELVRQLEADSPNKGSTTVFMAPPGVLVGKFGPTASKDQLAVALHKAGQCCDDPNCKHNHAAQPSTAAQRPTAQPQGARR